MADFYLVVWVLYLGPFLLALIYGMMTSLPESRNGHAQFDLGFVIVTFMVLTFFYQFHEARLTWVYMPILFAYLLMFAPVNNSDAGDRLAQGMTKILCGTFLAVGLFGLMVPPGDYWNPSFRFMALAPARAWFWDLLSIKTKDRYHLQTQCGSMTEICAAAITPTYDDYAQSSLQAYKNRHLRQLPM